LGGVDSVGSVGVGIVDTHSESSWGVRDNEVILDCTENLVYDLLVKSDQKKLKGTYQLMIDVLYKTGGVSHSKLFI
tara:strand:- start:381 stop:608 length:228 start_codon:yes stop_codon:yes gene_type:complete